MRLFSRAAPPLILLSGIFLRFYHLFHIDFVHEPYRLGGLFVAFAEQIIAGGFRFPDIIPFYSEGGIPFAYPPLGFYVEAVFLALFPGRQILIANLLPPFVSALTLIAAYFFLRRYFAEREYHAIAGLFAFAFLPNAFSNQIEAGGLAESFGTLALIVFFASAVVFRSRPGWKNAILTGLALGGCILSSPGSAIGATFLSSLLAAKLVVKSKFGPKVIVFVFVIAFVGMAVSAPYWLTVIQNHGKGIFVLPVLGQYHAAGGQSFAAVLFDKLTGFKFVQGGGEFPWTVIIFLGLLRLILRGKFARPVAFLVLFSIPRENTWLVAFPAALLFAHGVVDVLTLLARPVLDAPVLWKKGSLGFAVLLIAAWMAVQSFALVDDFITDQQWKITAEQIDLIQKSRALIPADAKVLVLGNDALLEWAPYLLQREVINTKFGLEWQPVELEKVLFLNQKIASATTWADVLENVSRLTGNEQIYTLSTDKKLLTSLTKDSTVPFELKLETSPIQIGILGTP